MTHFEKTNEKYLDLMCEYNRVSFLYHSCDLMYNDIRGYMERHHKDILDEYFDWRDKKGSAILQLSNGNVKWSKHIIP